MNLESVQHTFTRWARPLHTAEAISDRGLGTRLVMSP